MESSRVSEKAGIITAYAPCRADLAGGTMDLWPLYLFHPGALTLNFAVNILTSCRITPLKGEESRCVPSTPIARRASQISTN